jgi:DNA polymerase III subunit gamma/tau
MTRDRCVLFLDVMSYLPFHHKYRPQTFGDLVGQEAIAATLTNALRLGKIAPAYLFTGPRGTGKTSSARILAKSLNCIGSDAPTAEPCGSCAVCKSIANGNALDVIEIDAASNTGVDNIREIIERAQYAPVQCRYKVYTIDECHMLSTAAFNSLLKTLEEPPDRVVFILATTDPQRVLPTIISRCQKFDYRRIPLTAMVGHLQYIADREGVNITAPALQLVAQISQGGLRDAESLLDQLSLLEQQITPEKVWDLVGTVPERELLAIAQSVQSQDLEGLLDRCRQLVERGKEPLIILQNLTGFYRDLSIAKTAPQRPDLTNLTAETWPEVLSLANSLDLATILAAQQRLRESEAQLKNSTQPRLWLEIALLGLLSVPGPTASMAAPMIAPVTAAAIASPAAKTPSLAELPMVEIAPTPVDQAVPPEPPMPPVAQPPAMAAAIPAAPVDRSMETVTPPVAAAPPIPEPEIVPEPVQQVAPQIDLQATWQELLKQLLPSGRGLFAPYGSLLSIEADLALIGMKNATMSKFAEGQRGQVEKILSAILGRPIAVRIQHTSATAAPVATPAPKAAPISTPVSPPAPPLAAAEILEAVEEAPEPIDWEPINLPISTVAEQPSMFDMPPEHPSPQVIPQISTPTAPVAPQISAVAPSPPVVSVPASEPPAAPRVELFAPGDFDEGPEDDEPFTRHEVVDTGVPVLRDQTMTDLDAAAARLAARFAGEVRPELAIAWES